MFISILVSLIPSLINVVEKILPQSSGSDKKELVQSILKSLYDKFLQGHIPDLPGVDEEKIFIEVCSFLIDYFCEKLFNKGDG